MLTEIPYHHFIDANLLPENPVIIDVGACVGDSTEKLLELFPKAKIYVVEPSARNFVTLCKKFNNGSYKNNITLMNYALVGDDSITSVMFTGFVGLPEWGNVTGLNINTKHGKLIKLESYHVNTIILDKIVSKDTVIDYLKMDIEGAEYSVFENITSERASKIRQMSIELHTLPGREKVSLIDRINNLGFKTELIGDELYAKRV